MTDFSEIPLINRPIIQFLLNSLHSLSYWNDKRYCICLAFLMTLMVGEREKEKVWENLTNFSPNLEGETILHNLELPYFSYMLATPNPRKIMKRKKKGEEKDQKEEASLFLYDPRKKIVSTNWCSLASEEMIVNLYNPLPFSITVDAITVVSKNLKSSSHSGRFALKPFEQKKQVSVIVNIEEEGNLEISGILFQIKKLSYFLPCESNGTSTLTKNHSELPFSVI